MPKRVRPSQPASVTPEARLTESPLARLEALDPEFRTGVVELDEGLPGEVQILPVWASSEPFGYAGSSADGQVVGGGEAGSNAPSAASARAEREMIGPDAG